MTDQQQGNQEQSRMQTGNGVENIVQDEFTAANNVVEREQNPQYNPEEKRDEVQVQGGGGAIQEPRQDDQHVPRDGDQPEGRGEQQHMGEQARYRDRGTQPQMARENIQHNIGNPRQWGDRGSRPQAAGDRG